MKISRRNFIAATPAAVAVISQMDSIASARVFSSRDPLTKLTSASFLPYIGTDFTFRIGGRAVTLRLAVVEMRTPANYVSTSRGEECFGLHFTGGLGEPLTQDTFAVEHFAMRNFSLFITEGGVEGECLRYTAIFNRLVR